MAKKKNKTKYQNQYKGPYQHNPNIEFEQTRKNMQTPVSGPTADTRSYSDATINPYSPDNSPHKPNKPRPRTNHEKFKSWWDEHWKGAIITTFITVLTAAIGKVIYNHSNHFVALDKDIEVIQRDISDIENAVEKHRDEMYENKTQLELLQQRIQFEQGHQGPIIIQNNSQAQ